VDPWVLPCLGGVLQVGYYVAGWKSAGFFIMNSCEVYELVYVSGLHACQMLLTALLTFSATWSDHIPDLA
jgi:hypothetical protein